MENSRAKSGDTVAVHYTGRFLSGEVFDSSVAREEPISFTLGAGQMIPGFERAVLGMALNESKTVTLAPEEAYGPVNRDYILQIGRDQIPEDMNPSVGDQLMLTLADSSQVPVVVTDVTEAIVVLDGNHPMAGKTLVFDIRLVEIS